MHINCLLIYINQFICNKVFALDNTGRKFGVSARKIGSDYYSGKKI